MNKEIDPAPVIEMIMRGERTHAIQYIIEQTGVSLEEAYEAVRIETERFGPITLSLPKKTHHLPLTETKKLSFKYSYQFFDWFLTLGIFVFFLGFLVLVLKLTLDWLRYQSELGDWMVAVIMGIFFVCLVVAMFAARRLSAIITENEGEAIFNSYVLELVLKKQNIEIMYKEVEAIEYKKVVGSEDRWSFLPVGKMKVLLANGKKIELFSSRHEARKMKRAHGLVWKYKLNKDGSAPVPDVLLWKVCVELSERTGKNVTVNRIIERNSS
jgi:hypothetical protein